MKKGISFQLRITALSTAITFFLTGAGWTQGIGPSSAAQPAEGKGVNIPSLVLPEKWGSIEDRYDGGRQSPSVILIQDAHSIPDAQRSIQNLIEHFQTEHDVRLVALEGASGELDARFLRSFPDQELLRSVMEVYHQRGELAGGNAAAIFGPEADGFYGIEDWHLYEQGFKCYREVLARSDAVWEILGLLRKELQAQKEKRYSRKLLEMDQALEKFYRNEAGLIEVLRKASSVREPDKGTQLQLLLEETLEEENRRENEGLDAEVRGLAESVRRSLAAQASHGPDQLREFNARYQDYQTTRLSPEAFALFLQEFSREEGLPFRVSAELAEKVKRQRRLQDIRSTRLFDELELYLRSVRETLFRSEEEKILDMRTTRLRLLENLSRLELTWEDWKTVRGWQPQDLTEKEAEAMKEMEPHFTFYRNAAERDRVFYGRLKDLMKRKQAQSAVLVAGGFHAEALKRRFRERGISYAVITPRIDVLPAGDLYRAHMMGDVSWRDFFFKEEGGKIDFYKAFVRGTRNRLIEAGPEGSSPAGERLLKRWRDQIIRDLAREGKLAQARNYTRFIDELTQEVRQGMMPYPLLEKVRHFTEGLERLEASGRLTEQNILGLLQPATYLPQATGAAALVPGSESGIFPAVLSAARSELREEKYPGNEIFEASLRKHEARQAEVAAALGVGQPTVSEWIDRYGFRETVEEIKRTRTRRKTGPPTKYPGDKKFKEALERHDANYKKAGEELGADRVSVSNWVKAKGLEDFVAGIRKEREEEKEAEKAQGTGRYPGDTAFKEALRKHGGNYEATAREFENFSRQNVAYWVRKRQLKNFVEELRRQPTAKEDEGDERLSSKELFEGLLFEYWANERLLSEHLGVSRTVIRKWIGKHGLEDQVQRLRDIRSGISPPQTEAEWKRFFRDLRRQYGQELVVEKRDKSSYLVTERGWKIPPSVLAREKDVKMITRVKAKAGRERSGFVFFFGGVKDPAVDHVLVLPAFFIDREIHLTFDEGRLQKIFLPQVTERGGKELHPAFEIPVERTESRLSGAKMGLEQVKRYIIGQSRSRHDGWLWVKRLSPSRYEVSGFTDDFLSASDIAGEEKVRMTSVLAKGASNNKPAAAFRFESGDTSEAVVLDGKFIGRENHVYLDRGKVLKIEIPASGEFGGAVFEIEREPGKRIRVKRQDENWDAFFRSEREKNEGWLAVEMGRGDGRQHYYLLHSGREVPVSQLMAAPKLRLITAVSSKTSQNAAKVRFFTGTDNPDQLLHLSGYFGGRKVHLDFERGRLTRIFFPETLGKYGEIQKQELELPVTRDAQDALSGKISYEIVKKILIRENRSRHGGDLVLRKTGGRYYEIAGFRDDFLTVEDIVQETDVRVLARFHAVRVGDDDRAAFQFQAPAKGIPQYQITVAKEWIDEMGEVYMDRGEVKRIVFPAKEGKPGAEYRIFRKQGPDGAENGRREVKKVSPDYKVISEDQAAQPGVLSDGGPVVVLTRVQGVSSGQGREKKGAVLFRGSIIPLPVRFAGRTAHLHLESGRTSAVVLPAVYDDAGRLLHPQVHAGVEETQDGKYHVALDDKEDLLFWLRQTGDQNGGYIVIERRKNRYYANGWDVAVPAALLRSLPGVELHFQSSQSGVFAFGNYRIALEQPARKGIAFIDYGLARKILFPAEGVLPQAEFDIEENETSLLVTEKIEGEMTRWWITDKKSFADEKMPEGIGGEPR